MPPSFDLIQRIRRTMKPVGRPPMFFWAALSISLGGFLNGFDTGAIGAITVMDTFEARIGTLSPMLRGLVVSLLLLSGTPTSLIAGALADKYGHLAIVLAGAILFTAGALLETASVDLAMLLVGRILLGAGEGLYLGNINVYICEIAPKARRGMLVAMPQLLVTAGLCAGYFTCYGTIRLSNEWQWRIPFLVQVIGGAAFAIATYLLPSSPRWLLQKAQPEKARESLQQLGLTDDELSLELRPNELQEREQSTTPGAGDGAGTLSSNVMLELFSKEYRFRTILALFILGMVQLCGIDGVLYYAPTLFAQAGLASDTASFVASGVSALLMFAISIPAFLTADAFGRRNIVAVGGVLLSGCMLAIGGIYSTSEQGGDAAVARRWAIIVLIFLFALTYVATWAIVGKIYASEIQPAQTRATANSLAQALNFFTNFLTAFITPIFLAASPSGPYFLFAGCTLFTLLVLWAWMPETRARSLEAIQENFVPPVETVVSRLAARVGRLRHRR